MRKFYEIAEAVFDGNRYAIHLDGKSVKTPQKITLTVATKALADSIAEEWRVQEVFIVPATMPLTQLASTAIDQITPNLNEAATVALEYAKTDLVCYRADEPDELVVTQAVLFDPLLEWFEERSGHALVVARGVMPVEQPADTLQAVRGVLIKKSAEQLTALQVSAALASSLVIALALCEGEISAEEAYQAAFSEELYQIQKWGEDEEARARLNLAKSEFQKLEKFVGLLS